jgi:hypothetical protein
LSSLNQPKHNCLVENSAGGQNVNAGDCIMSLLSFPVSDPLQVLLANPPILVLDDVRNSENIGSILRTGCVAPSCSRGTQFYDSAAPPLLLHFQHHDK